MSKTSLPKIYIGRLEPSDWDRVQELIAILEPSQSWTDTAKVRNLLRNVIPELTEGATAETRHDVGTSVRRSGSNEFSPSTSGRIAIAVGADFDGKVSREPAVG